MNKIIRIMKEWKKEAGVKEPVLLKYRSGKLEIHTNRPGFMIGLHGRIVNKYTEILKNNVFGFKELEFVETDFYA